jgi:hypothetical protein
MNKPTALRALLVPLALSLLISACAGTAAPSAPAGSEGPPSATPGGGGDQPIDGGPGGPGGVIDPSQPQLVIPKPGQQNVHPVAIVEMDARVDGRHAVLNARWWSGVEACYVLDSVAWKRDGTNITVSVREGSPGGDVICIDIAVYKATVIDLGQLEPGEYTVVADKGDAKPITFTIA